MFSALAARSRGTFPLLSSFFAFWEEVEALRRDVLPEGHVDGRLLRGPASGREQLAEVLRKQRAAMAQSCAFGVAAAVRRSAVLMAATADELFIGLNWEGADNWRLHPLEAELFGTRRAGQEIFARLERLIDGSNPFNAEMAAVYLTALELGFKGTFADADDTHTLERYETDLRKMVGGSPMHESPAGPTVLRQHDRGGFRAQMPASRVWWWAALGIAGICLLAVVIVAATRFRGTNARTSTTEAGDQLRPHDGATMMSWRAILGQHGEPRYLLLGPAGAGKATLVEAATDPPCQTRTRRGSRSAGVVWNDVGGAVIIDVPDRSRFRRLDRT